MSPDGSLLSKKLFASSRRGDGCDAGIVSPAGLPRERTPTLAVGIASMLRQEKIVMNNIIWLIGAIVVVLAILSFLGLR